MTGSLTPFPIATYGDWIREVESAGSEGARERLGSETLDGVTVAPLYTRESTPAPLPRPRKATKGWESWVSVTVPTPVDGAGRVEEAWRLGAGGVRLHLTAAARAADLDSILAAAAAREIAVSTAGTAPAAILAAAMPDGPTGFRGSLGIPGLEAACAPGLTAEALRWADSGASGFRAFTVSAESPDDVGAGAVFELAWMLAETLALLRAGEKGGCEPQTVLARTEVLLPVGRDVYLQIGKLRAARVLWAVLAASLEIDPDAVPLRLLARTSWRTKTRWDAKTNLLRETMESFAAVVGGCDALLGRPFDGGGTELGRRLRSTLPLVLRDEGRLVDVEDPAAGGWAIEALTRRLAEAAWQELQRIEAEGGLRESLLAGGLQERMAEIATRRAASLRTRREPVLGVSLYPRQEPDPPVSHQRGDSPRRVAAATSWRDLVDAARSADVAATEARLGAARFLVAAVWSDAAAFERFRDRAAARREPPRARLVGIGTIRDLSAPLSFARQLLVAGGFGVASPGPFETLDAAMADLADTSEDLVVLVLPKDADPATRARAVETVRGALAIPLAVTGRDEIPGVRHRLWAGCDAVAVLEALWEEVDS